MYYILRLTMIMCVICSKSVKLDNTTHFSKYTKQGCTSINETNELRGFDTQIQMIHVGN